MKKRLMASNVELRYSRAFWRETDSLSSVYVVVMDDVEALGTYGQYIIDGYAQGLVECTTMTSQYVVGVLNTKRCVHNLQPKKLQ